MALSEIRAPGFWSQVKLMLLKDLRLEWRSREIVYTMALFSVLLVIIFSFAFAEDGQPQQKAAGGLLWVAITFSGTLGMSRFYDREREGETIRALLLSPAQPAAIYTAKLLAILLFMGATELAVVPLLIGFFRLQVASYAIFLGLVAAGTLGFAAVGSLFAAGLMRARSRDVLLAILTYPIALPVIIAGAKGTAALTAVPSEIDSALTWLDLLGAFDLVFIVVALWVFGPLVSSD